MNLWTHMYYKCRNNWNERSCLGTFIFSSANNLRDHSRNIQHHQSRKNIPESSSGEEKVAATGNWSSMWMDMLCKSVKQTQNCPHRGVRELQCLLTPIQPSFFFFLASQHGMQDLSSPNQGWNSCPPAVEVQSLNHWTIREAPIPHFLGLFLCLPSDVVKNVLEW